MEGAAAVCWPRYTLDTNVYSALLSHVRSQWSRTDWPESPDGIGAASCARSCSRQIKASKVSRVDVNALSRSCGWQQRDWTDSDWQSSWLGAEVLTKGLGLRCRPRLEPSLHDCFGGMTVRDSMRCFSVLLLRWQWGEQECPCCAHRGLLSENRHSHSTSSCSSAQCVPSLKQTSCSCAGFVVSCVVIVRCVLPGSQLRHVLRSFRDLALHL